jgi:IclR family acetate operon transcriptional repressor
MDIPPSSAKQTSIAKALILLRELAKLSTSGEVKLGNLARASGFNKATTHRLLRELRAFELVEQQPVTGTYSLGKMILVLNAEYEAGLDLRKRALPVLESLTKETDLTAHLAVRDGDEVVYIEKVETTHNIRIASGIGWRGKLHCTSLGKALIAFGEEELLQLTLQKRLEKRTPNTIVSPAWLKKELITIRQLGYAVDDSENQLEVRCVAAPIFDRYSKPIAAISVSGTISQLPKKNVAAVGGLVKRHALNLSEEMGYKATRK